MGPDEVQVVVQCAESNCINCLCEVTTSKLNFYGQLSMINIYKFIMFSSFVMGFSSTIATSCFAILSTLRTSHLLALLSWISKTSFLRWVLAPSGGW